ncbi:hypothetical protein RJ639_045878 [Escallonia herrerae]|uniref:BED-type domain-containing protein n=1 Tax=Escallonia herrerae TaxID=1293975 RepID=A0AA89B416_9ASTE|nr:hypothetical protein RJ639_045878 [Escallonia herrerae]
MAAPANIDGGSVQAGDPAATARDTNSYRDGYQQRWDRSAHGSVNLAKNVMSEIAWLASLERPLLFRVSDANPPAEFCVRNKIMSSNEITSSPVASSPVQTPRATLEDQTSEPSTPNASMGVSASEPVDLDSGPDDLNNENLKSSVWAHFERKKNGGNVTATCSHCRKTLGANPKNGTTHLRMHLDRCKRLRQPDVRQKLLAGIMSKANAKPELGNYSFDQDFAKRELGTMIILHEYSLSIVDHVGFRRYSSALQPLFKIPTRNSVKSDIINIYEHEREQVMKLLEGIRSRVAVTTDLWTSGNQKKGFMAVTGHFIDEEFILQSRILRYALLFLQIWYFAI